MENVLGVEGMAWMRMSGRGWEIVEVEVEVVVVVSCSGGNMTGGKERGE